MILELSPQTTASTNPFGITFSSSAECELAEAPKMAVNKNIGIVDLDYVNEVGIIISKGTIKAMIPWANIMVLRY